jgi:hypothetical protein
VRPVLPHANLTAGVGNRGNPPETVWKPHSRRGKPWKPVDSRQKRKGCLFYFLKSTGFHGFPRLLCGFQTVSSGFPRFPTPAVRIAWGGAQACRFERLNMYAHICTGPDARSRTWLCSWAPPAHTHTWVDHPGWQGACACVPIRTLTRRVLPVLSCYFGREGCMCPVRLCPCAPAILRPSACARPPASPGKWKILVG